MMPTKTTKPLDRARKALHLAAVRRADSAAIAATALVRATWRRIRELLANADPSRVAALQHELGRLLRGMLGDVQGDIADQLRRAMRKGLDDNAALLAETVPVESWVALAKAKGGKLEADLFDPDGEFSLDYDRLLRLAGRLTKKQFEKAVASIAFPPPTRAKAQSILRGDTWPDRLTWPRRLAREGFSFDQITNQVTLGVSRGENIADITQRIRPLVDGIQYRAARIARTESLRVAAETQKEATSVIADLVYGMEIHGTLDNRIRPEHRERDGTQYIKPGHEGRATSDKVLTWAEYPNVPDAPNCRCWGTELILGVHDE